MSLFARIRRWFGPSAVDRAATEQTMTPAEQHEVDEGPEGMAVDEAAERRFDEPYPSDE